MNDTTPTRRQRVQQARATAAALADARSRNTRARWDWALDCMRQTISPNTRSGHAIYRAAQRAQIAQAIRLLAPAASGEQPWPLNTYEMLIAVERLYKEVK